MLAEATQHRALHLEKRTASRFSILSVWFFLWLGSYLALALIDIWLWQHAAISRELLFWEAHRRLVIDGHPSDLAALVATSQPLVFYGVLLAGSALNLAALLGATAITVLAVLLRRAGAPLLWLPLIALHPSLLIGAFQYPSLMMRSLLLLVTVSYLLAYLYDTNAYQLCIAALALGALTLIDLNPWPLWLFIALALVVAQKRTRQELTTLGLVAFFPAVFISLSWFYLHAVAIGTGVSATTWASGGATRLMGREWPALLGTLVYAIPAYLLLLMLIALSSRRPTKQLSSTTRHIMGIALILAIPIVDVLLRYATGRVSQISDTPLDAAALVLTLPLLMLPLLWGAVARIARDHSDKRRASILRGVVGFLLLIGLITSWTHVAQQVFGEPQQMLRRAIGRPEPIPQDSFRAVADVLNQQLQPGQRVMLDDSTLFPLVALIDRSDALLLPYQLDYALAVQNPADWADYVVLADTQGGSDPTHTGDLAQGMSNYRLVMENGNLQLYQRQGSSTAATSLFGGKQP